MCMSVTHCSFVLFVESLHNNPSKIHYSTDSSNQASLCLRSDSTFLSGNNTPLESNQATESLCLKI